MRDRQMQVCTHQSRFALVSMAFQLRNAKKYTGYCIIACVPMWWGKVDSNHRRHCQQIYSLSPLATREIPQIYGYSIGAGGRIRTPDLLITNQLLYRLSYTSI